MVSQRSIELAADARQRESNLDGEQYIIVDLAGGSYAISLGLVQEVERIPTIAHVPGSPSWIGGVVNLRGSVLALVALSRLLELGAWESSNDARMLVAGGDDPVALAVDRVRGMRRLSGLMDSALLSTLPGLAGEYVTAVYRDGSDFVGVLDLATLLDNAGREQGSAGLGDRVRPHNGGHQVDGTED